LARQNTTLVSLPDLPVAERISELRSALASGHALLSAEPGSGKTTLVPLLLLDEAWLAGRKILVLEPRRPAARMAARRMAELFGEEVGATIGYQVRFERRLSAKTRIEVLTEGLLLRRLQDDPELPGVGLVIFDEFHERKLIGDLSLALCLDIVAGMRDDLRLLVMSATLDQTALLSLLPATAVVAEGSLYPVEIFCAEHDAELRDPLPVCMNLLGRALQECTGDVLVFLPGRREIERMRDQVTERWGDRVDAMPLFGDLPVAAQDAVLQGPGKRRRVILATDIAETSLTIAGVEAVVDSGLTRTPAFDPNAGLSRLETRRISKASARQRAGRAGRLGPGRCYRAWGAARDARLLDWTPPEIVEADLASLVLELANWGVTDSAALCLLDSPPPAHWAQAVDLLRDLGALDGDGRSNAQGRAMGRFPVHPRLAHMLTMACATGRQAVAADLAALVSEPDPLRHATGVGVDVALRLDALAALRNGTGLAAGCDRALLRRIDQVAQQYRRLCRPSATAAPAVLPVGPILALAYPDRVALGTSPDGRRFLMRNGRAALLDAADPLCGSEALVIAGVDAGRRDGHIRMAAKLDRAQLDTLFADRIEARRELRWDSKLSDVVARAVRRLDALVLSEEAVPLCIDDSVAELLLAQIRADGLARFFDDPVDLRARVCLMRQVDAAGDWPDFTEPGLLGELEIWLLPWLRAGEGARQLRAIKLYDALSAVLGRERLRRLDQWLPTHIETPASTRRPIRYRFEEQPVLAVPLQEVLGLCEGPTLAMGRLSLVLHLLSPAGRPLQVTSDLAAFWDGAYEQVKKEMRGRYPKHHWPDDPVTAKATRLGKRNRR